MLTLTPTAHRTSAVSENGPHRGVDLEAVAFGLSLKPSLTLPADTLFMYRRIVIALDIPIQPSPMSFPSLSSSVSTASHTDDVGIALRTWVSTVGSGRQRQHIR